MAELRAAGLPPEVSERWLISQASWQRIALAAQSELDDLSVEAARVIQWQVAAAAQAGAEAGLGLVGMLDQASNFGIVPSLAVEAAIGVFQPGTVFAQLPGLNEEAVRQIGREVTRGLASGLHSSVIGRNIANASSVPAARAATIARTETFRAYREANREIYKQHRLVNEWRWVCSLGDRTCAACWSMHGSLHPVEEPMGTHPNCRCTMIPTIPGGFNGPTGSELFDELDPDQQRAILGPAKYDAFKRGEIKLPDVVRKRESKDWGTSRSVASLKEARHRAKPGSTPKTKSSTSAPKKPEPSRITFESTVSRSPALRNVKEAIESISAVHNPKVRIIFRGRPHKNGLLGSFGWYAKRGDMVGSIGIKQGSRASITAVHEIGHALDLQLFGRVDQGVARQGTAYASSPDSPMNGWLRAVDATAVRDRIRQEYPHSYNTRAYLSSTEELFARSYEQWITTKTSNAAYRKELEQEIEQYWTEEEFKTISLELDKLFGVSQ